MTKSKQEWESVLEKEWDEDGFLDGLYPNSYKKLIKFINNLILEERQRVVEIIEGMKWDSREEITEWLLGKEDTAKRSMLLDEVLKNISDLQSKLKEDK